MELDEGHPVEQIPVRHSSAKAEKERRPQQK